MGTTRELTLKERTTEDLKSRLRWLRQELRRQLDIGGVVRPLVLEIEAVDDKLEERSKYEQKVSRW